jgi:hypothetical protein
MPKAIWSRPAMTTAAKINCGWPGAIARRPTVTTVIGPVGPDTCPGVPPKSAAKMPQAIAP